MKISTINKTIWRWCAQHQLIIFTKWWFILYDLFSVFSVFTVFGKYQENNKTDKYNCYLIRFNMKPARPWMLAHLKIIWQFHQKSVEIFWAEVYWGRLFLGPNLVSFNRAVVPLFKLSFLTREGTRLQDHLCALC